MEPKRKRGRPAKPKPGPEALAKPAEPGHKGGRKPAVVDITQAESVAAMGGTNEQIAFALGVADGTLKKLRRENPALNEAILRGKDRADIQIVGALYNKAKGGGRCPHCHKPVPGLAGDTTAMIFWLKNRQSEQWRDRHDVNNTGKIEHDGKLIIEVVKTK